jgi:hypothetical protein
MPPYLRVLFSGLLLTLVALGACHAQRPVSSLGERPTQASYTPTPQPATAEEAIRQLVVLEGRNLVSQDIEGLMDLWAEDGTVTDAKHTPDDPADDARWEGRDAIRERYVVLVFPGNPQTAGDPNIAITIEGEDDGATATAVGTSTIGGEVSPGGDRWTFVKRDGRWWISSLTYNLETE